MIMNDLLFDTQEETEIIQVDPVALRQQLGIVQLEQAVKVQQGIIQELLLYMNQIEQLALQYNGEPVLRKEISASLTNMGIELTGKRAVLDSLEGTGLVVPGSSPKKSRITVNNA